MRIAVYTEIVYSIRCLIVCLLAALPASAALSIMPIGDVRAGMHGTGKTVFSGDKIDDFDVEILGILENTGPKQSLILGRLSGGPLDHTHIFATWAFRVGIEGNDIPLGASVSLFMAPILAVAAIFILRDINKRGNEA